MNRGIAIGVIALLFIGGTVFILRQAEPKGPLLPKDGYDVDRITVQHEDIEFVKQALNMGEFERFLAVMNLAERTDEQDVGDENVITIDLASSLTRTFYFLETEGNTILHETGNVLYPKLSRYYIIKNRTITGLGFFAPDDESDGDE